VYIFILASSESVFVDSAGSLPDEQDKNIKDNAIVVNAVCFSARSIPLFFDVGGW